MQSAGLTYRPIPTISLKVEGNRFEPLGLLSKTESRLASRFRSHSNELARRGFESSYSSIATVSSQPLLEAIAIQPATQPHFEFKSQVGFLERSAMTRFAARSGC